MNSNAVRIAIPNVNHYVNPQSLAWLGDRLEPLGSPAGQLQRELLKAAEQLVAEGTRRLAHSKAEAADFTLPAGMADAAPILAKLPQAAHWLALTSKMQALEALLADPQPGD
jgi:hypothetical protein